MPGRPNEAVAHLVHEVGPLWERAHAWWFEQV